MKCSGGDLPRGRRQAERGNMGHYLAWVWGASSSSLQRHSGGARCGTPMRRAHQRSCLCCWNQLNKSPEGSWLRTVALAREGKEAA